MEPIHTAATFGNVDALRRELAKNVSPDLVCPNGFVPLHNVVAGAYGRGGNNEVACIHLLVAAGANVNARVGSVPGSLAGEMISLTALMIAVAEGHSTLVAALLDAGSDVNNRDRLDWTPLHFAIYSEQNNEESARLLINAGASVDARDDLGRTPLDLAVLLNERRRLYPILLRAGAALPAETDDAYLRKVIAAGGFRHTSATTSTPSPRPSPRSSPTSRRRWSAASSSTRSTRGITKKVRKRSILCRRTRTKRPTSAGPCRRRRRARGPSPGGCRAGP